MAAVAAERLRLSPEDKTDLEFLVLEHLSMFKLSQRRDLEDPDLVARFAARLEHYARAAPYNWFNFYDFWKTESPQSAGSADAAAGPVRDGGSA